MGQLRMSSLIFVWVLKHSDDTYTKKILINHSGAEGVKFIYTMRCKILLIRFQKVFCPM